VIRLIKSKMVFNINMEDMKMAIILRTSHPTVTLEHLNKICMDNTAFGSFDDLLTAKGDYRPSINCEVPDLKVLADCYDEIQEKLGDNRRAYRY